MDSVRDEVEKFLDVVIGPEWLRTRFEFVLGTAGAIANSLYRLYVCLPSNLHGKLLHESLADRLRRELNGAHAADTEGLAQSIALFGVYRLLGGSEGCAASQLVEMNSEILAQAIAARRPDDADKFGAWQIQFWTGMRFVANAAAVKPLIAADHLSELIAWLGGVQGGDDSGKMKSLRDEIFYWLESG